MTATLRAHLDGYDGVMLAALVVGGFVGLCVLGMAVSLAARLRVTVPVVDPFDQAVDLGNDTHAKNVDAYERLGRSALR